MKRVVLVLAAVAVASCKPGPSPELLREYQGRSLVTCCNIHYEQDEINDANYYIGTTIPLGTPVTIQNVGRDSVTFTANGKTLTLYQRYGSAQEPFQKYLDKILVSTDPKAQLAGFSHSAQEAIREGRVERGMTKEQVIMSLGYPATHRTPSLDSNDWLYWYNRWVTYRVQFDDKGQVSMVVGRPAPTRDQVVEPDAPTPPVKSVPAKSKAKPKKK